MENNYKSIPAEKFTFVQKDTLLKDKKLDTKARSYLADAFIRFRKNKDILPFHAEPDGAQL